MFCNELNDSDTDEQDDKQDEDFEIFNSICTSTPSTVHMTNVCDVDTCAQSKDDCVDIFAVGVHPPNFQSKEFIGACTDSGTQRTVIGSIQAAFYCSLAGINLSLTPNPPLQFKFGDATHRGHGTLNVRLPISTDHFIGINAHIVHVDVLLLIRLDVLTDI